jgi:hypothetical protein
MEDKSSFKLLIKYSSVDLNGRKYLTVGGRTILKFIIMDRGLGSSGLEWNTLMTVVNMTVNVRVC